MQTVHLDTDIGGDMDDLCALAMLLKWPSLTITGITTVADDNGKRNGYVKRVLELAGREEIPCAAGADVRSGMYRYIPGYPADIRYWGTPVTPCPTPVEDALRLLKASIEAGATIICIGQFTNLYLLDKRYPGILQSADVVLMGGYTHPIREGLPQWDNTMDYNIQLDVRSANHVIEHSDPLVVPLGITVQTAIRRAYLSGLRAAGPVEKLIAEQAEVFAVDEHNEATYGSTCPLLPPDIINFQHDPLACAIALGWRDGVVIESLPLVLRKIDGWLHETVESGGKFTRIVTQIDGNRFNQFWFDLMTTPQ
jgi:purine nucleosidase